VHVITRRTLKQFAERHHAAQKPLDNWYHVATKAHWRTIADVRADYPHADAAGRCTVFNIGGNKYRLITKIRFDRQVLYIRFILPHGDYDKGGWKNDCGC
jgi:mRNA interferase HigB